MKKTILVVLMVAMVATPCLAEVETEGIFSVEGTLWQALPMGVQISPFPYLVPMPNDLEFGFYGGTVYAHNLLDSFYIDMFVCSIFWGLIDFPFSATGRYYGMLLPIGIGIFVETGPPYYGDLQLGITIDLLIKTSDNWKPPELVSMSPNQGEQGTILTDVQITCLNTNFDTDSGIHFFPSVGIDISNWTVISNTQVEFDITIAADAPIGFRDIVIWYDDNGPKTDIRRTNAFEVIEKTN